MDNYATNLGQRALNKLHELRTQTSQGLEELSRHPVRYTATSLRDLVKDYWDVGAAVLAGFAFNDRNDQIFGNYRWPVALSALMASDFGSYDSVRNMLDHLTGKESISKKEDLRSTRNTRAGLAAALYWWYRENPNAPEMNVLIDKLGGLAFAALSLRSDFRRRKIISNSPPSSLDSLAE